VSRQGLSARSRKPDALTVPLDQLIREGRLTEIPGVGEAIADTGAG
jgi:hypothetical protein